MAETHGVTRKSAQFAKKQKKEENKLNREEIISELQTLLSEIQKVANAELSLTIAKSKYSNAINRKPTKVANFDIAYKEQYIISKIGQAPEKPKGIIKLAVPIYLSKKKEYDKLYNEYTVRYQLTEQQYYTEYSDQRSKLESDERAEISHCTQLAETEKHEAMEALKTAKKTLAENSLLSDELKTKETVEDIIKYLQNQRVDTIRDAVNLYYEEQHRRKLEALAEKQVHLAEDAAEYARQAAASAREAANSAQEAITRADEAYNKADAAYFEAQNAYHAVTSNRTF